MSAPFKLNGAIEPIDEPYPFLEQAHAVLGCLIDAVEDENGGSVPPARIASAARAARTLVHLAAQGLDVMDARRAAREAVQHD